MKTWLAKLRISVALDAGKALPAAERPSVRSGEVRQFAHGAQMLDRALKQARPQVAVPGALHGSIMRAVRASEPVAATPRRPNWWLWVPAPALTLLALLGLWWLLQPRSNPPHSPVVAPGSLTLHAPRSTLHAPSVSLATAATALQVGEQVNRAVSGTAMVTPLTEELGRVNQDLDATAQFLLASLP